MSDLTFAICMILFGLNCFILGLYIGHRRLKSRIFPIREIEDPKMQVVYIDPKIVRKMYGIPEPKERP